MDPNAIEVTGALGHSLLAVSIPAIDAPAQIQIYRAPAGTPLDRDVHAVGIPLTTPPASTVSYTDGDATRTNLLSNPGFDTDTVWSLGADWSITGGKARRDALGNSYLSQPVTFEPGRTYRIAWWVSDATNGGGRIRFLGGTLPDTGWTSGLGLQRGSLIAEAGSDTFGIFSGNQFDGAIDDFVLFEETATCIPAGTFDYYLEPLNDENIAGPVSRPFTVDIC